MKYKWYKHSNNEKKYDNTFCNSTFSSIVSCKKQLDVKKPINPLPKALL